MNEDKTKSKIKALLAEHLGVEVEDIKDNYSLTDDLHMTASDLTDFFKMLETEGFEPENIDLTSIESFSDLCESLEDFN